MNVGMPSHSGSIWYASEEGGEESNHKSNSKSCRRSEEEGEEEEEIEIESRMNQNTQTLPDSAGEAKYRCTTDIYTGMLEIKFFYY